MVEWQEGHTASKRSIQLIPGGSFMEQVEADRGELADWGSRREMVIKWKWYM